MAEADLLRQFGVEGIVGPEAVARVERIFAENAANPTAIVAALQQHMPELDQLAQRTEGLVKALGPMLGAMKGELGPDDGHTGRLWLRFDHKVSVETMQELPKAVERWTSILHHFSRVKPGTDATAHLLVIEKHSPLVIEVAAAVSVLAPLTWGINLVVNSLGRIIDLGKKLEELKQMKAKSGILEGIAEQIKEERALIAKEAANEVQKQFNADPEARNAVEIGLKEVLAFIEGGGEVDVDVPAGEGEGDAASPAGLSGASLKKAIEGMRRDLLALPPRVEE